MIANIISSKKLKMVYMVIYICTKNNVPIEEANCFRNRDCHDFKEKGE